MAQRGSVGVGNRINSGPESGKVLNSSEGGHRGPDGATGGGGHLNFTVRILNSLRGSGGPMGQRGLGHKFPCTKAPLFDHMIHLDMIRFGPSPDPSPYHSLDILTTNV